jgi:hypothetical protein
MTEERPFTPEDIRKMTLEMRTQLDALRRAQSESRIRWIGRGRSRFPEPQVERAEKAAAAAGQDSKGFWERFKKAAREDICQEGGTLHAQWKKWGDLSDEKVLQQFGAVLVAMGFSGDALQVAAVALAVIVAHLGVKAFCMETADADDATDAASGKDRTDQADSTDKQGPSR